MRSRSERAQDTSGKSRTGAVGVTGERDLSLVPFEELDGKGINSLCASGCSLLFFLDPPLGAFSKYLFVPDLPVLSSVPSPGNEIAASSLFAVDLIALLPPEELLAKERDLRCRI